MSSAMRCRESPYGKGEGKSNKDGENSSKSFDNTTKATTDIRRAILLNGFDVIIGVSK